MGIECGQGGLKIDTEPLQRCGYWDMREEVGVKIHLDPLNVVFFTSLVGGFTQHEWWNTHALSRKVDKNMN